MQINGWTALSRSQIVVHAEWFYYPSLKGFLLKFFPLAKNETRSSVNESQNGTEEVFLLLAAIRPFFFGDTLLRWFLQCIRVFSSPLVLTLKEQGKKQSKSIAALLYSCINTEAYMRLPWQRTWASASGTDNLKIYPVIPIPDFLNDSFLLYKKEMHSGWNKMQRWKRDIWVRNFLFQLNAAKKSKKNKSSGSSDFFSCKMHGDFKEKYHIHFP